VIYNFDTNDEQCAVAALLIYVIYRSRNTQRFKVTPDMWSRIFRFTQSAAKRSKTIPDFLSKFSKKMDCESINPKWMKIATNNSPSLLQIDDYFIEFNNPLSRYFMTKIIDDLNMKDNDVIKLLKTNTSWIILLVRERLEREKQVENILLKEVNDNE
jgi:hypothetical protein